MSWLGQFVGPMNSRNRFYNNHTIASIVSTRYLVVNELDATREDMKQVN